MQKLIGVDIRWTSGLLGLGLDQLHPIGDPFLRSTETVRTIDYAGVALKTALAYTLLSAAIIQADPSNHLLADALGNDLKGKLSLAAYVLALVAPFTGQLGTMISGLLMVAVALMWLISDRRIERALEQTDQKPLG